MKRLDYSKVLTLLTISILAWQPAFAGGINPQAPKTNINRALAQQFSESLFTAIANFYSSHVAIEKSVLGETDEIMGGANDANIDEPLEKAAGRMQRSLQSVTVAKEIAEVISTSQDCSVVYQDFFKAQVKKLIELEVILQQLASATKSPSVRAARENQRLQVSLWHDEENAVVRKKSIDLVRKLNQLLSAYLYFVEQTNQ